MRIHIYKKYIFFNGFNCCVVILFFFWHGIGNLGRKGNGMDSWIIVIVHVKDCDLVQHGLYCTNFLYFLGCLSCFRDQLEFQSCASRASLFSFLFFLVCVSLFLGFDCLNC